jgi:hypothetical protein
MDVTAFHVMKALPDDVARWVPEHDARFRTLFDSVPDAEMPSRSGHYFVYLAAPRAEAEQR